VMALTIPTCRSWTSRMTWVRPTPMWCMRPWTRRVTAPVCWCCSVWQGSVRAPAVDEGVEQCLKLVDGLGPDASCHPVAERDRA